MAARRPDFQVFNELLVQYPLTRRKRLGQVVPDNMVVIHPEPIDAVGSYDVPLQPVGPFWALEYVSKSNRRKDYVDNMRKYEHELKVPYHLLFEPDKEQMTLYRHTGERFVSVAPDENGRCAVEELEIEVGLLGGWVRFWHQGELLPLPARFAARPGRDKASAGRVPTRVERDDPPRGSSGTRTRGVAGARQEWQELSRRLRERTRSPLRRTSGYHHRKK